MRLHRWAPHGSLKNLKKKAGDHGAEGGDAIKLEKPFIGGYGSDGERLGSRPYSQARPPVHDDTHQPRGADFRGKLLARRRLDGGGAQQVLDVDRGRLLAQVVLRLDPQLLLGLIVCAVWFRGMLGLSST